MSKNFHNIDPSICIVITYLSGAPFRIPHSKYAPSLGHKHETRIEMSSIGKRSSISRCEINYNHKKHKSTDTPPPRLLCPCIIYGEKSFKALTTEREVHLCRWKTPYLNTYIVGEGIYVERGRIQGPML